VCFPDAGGGDPLGAGLDLEMRSRVVAGATSTILDSLLAVGSEVEA
jgi:hypothetical protein